MKKDIKTKHKYYGCWQYQDYSYHDRLKFLGITRADSISNAVEIFHQVALSCYERELDEERWELSILTKDVYNQISVFTFRKKKGSPVQSRFKFEVKPYPLADLHQLKKEKKWKLTEYKVPYWNSNL